MRTTTLALTAALIVVAGGLTGCYEGRPGHASDHHRGHHHRGDHGHDRGHDRWR